MSCLFIDQTIDDIQCWLLQLQSMMTSNEEVPDIEKLARHEFDLDIEDQKRLQKEGDAEVRGKSQTAFFISFLNSVLFCLATKKGEICKKINKLKKINTG